MASLTSSGLLRGDAEIRIIAVSETSEVYVGGIWKGNVSFGD